MSKASSVPHLGFPKAEGGPEAWLGCLWGHWLQAGLPTGHLASSTCVLIRILITTVREMLPSKQLCSLGSCVWCRGVGGERGGGLGVSSADAERRALPVGLGQSGLRLPRLSPPHVLPWIPWTAGKSGPTWVPACAGDTAIRTSGAQGGTRNKRNRVTCTPVTPRASRVTGLVHSSGPRPWVGSPGPEKLQGLPAARPAPSLTLAFPVLGSDVQADCRAEGRRTA